MKDILFQYYAITGFVVRSPREVLRELFRAELIYGDEWMSMLKVRNQLAYERESTRSVRKNTYRAGVFRLFQRLTTISQNAEKQKKYWGNIEKKQKKK